MRMITWSDHKTNSRRRLYWMASSPILLVVIVWETGFYLSRNIHPDGPNASFDYTQPDPRVPGAARDVVLNNQNAAKGMMPDLDGLAIIYDDRADQLVGPDGRWIVDLSAISQILRFDVMKDTVLFRARAGRLTDESRAIARADRLEGNGQYFRTYAIWSVKDYAFTVEQLRRASPEDKVILDAIRTAKAVPLKPGSRVRAVGTDHGEMERGGLLLTPGHLPIEAPATP